MANELDILIGRMLRDIEIELTDEFDKNFERQAYFNEAWQRRSSPVRGDGHLLVDTGALRRSITCKKDSSSITLQSTLPYAAIHNEGGEIMVTDKMKRFFWAKYYEATGSFGRRKDGSLRQNKQNGHLSSVADFWKKMALMKVGTKIKMPKRQFLGYHPIVDKAVKEIVEENLREYFEKEMKNNLDPNNNQ